jgi:hypothetical protein
MIGYNYCVDKSTPVVVSQNYWGLSVWTLNNGSSAEQIFSIY